MPAVKQNDLIDRLPPVAGELTANAPIARYTWFRVGGEAEILFEPEGFDDLSAFLRALDNDIAVTTIGIGSNLIVRDGGIPGVTIRLGRAFAGISNDKTTVAAEAGAACITVARAARDAGIAGLEFLSGIPGTIGGAIRMNAGAYGTEINDVLNGATAFGRDGGVHELDLAALAYSYRHCGAPEDLIFVTGTFQGTPDTPEAIAERMAKISAAREESQPIRERTGGSTFKNPPGAKAWKLIDEAGCRGLCLGGAQVSNLHCNFLINTGEATAADLEGLGEAVRRRVLEKTGIELEWEIRLIGVSAPQITGEAP
jgi:UDP-N-acetylmuramate dehydrogenase